MPVDGGFAASNVGGTTPPSASGRQEIAAGGGVPPPGVREAKEGEDAGGQKRVQRQGIEKKKARVRTVIPKQDVYAVMYVQSDVGTSEANVFESDRFLLTQVIHQQAERYQVVDTFLRALIYFMGKAPEIYSYSGTLYNCSFEQEEGSEGEAEPNWRDDFLKAYDEQLRGTRCVETRTRVFLDYDGLLVSGYMLNNQVPILSDIPNAVQFSFSLFVTSRRILGG